MSAPRHYSFTAAITVLLRYIDAARTLYAKWQARQPEMAVPFVVVDESDTDRRTYHFPADILQVLTDKLFALARNLEPTDPETANLILGWWTLFTISSAVLLELRTLILDVEARVNTSGWGAPPAPVVPRLMTPCRVCDNPVLQPDALYCSPTCEESQRKADEATQMMGL